MSVIRNTVSPQFHQVSQTGNNLPSYTVALYTYAVCVVEAASLAWACHNLGVSTTCEMAPAGHSPSTQPVHYVTAHMHITPAVADMTRDLDRDCHYTRLHTQVRDRKRVLVEPCGGTTQRWHAKLLVSYSCCLRGTEHDTGAQGPENMVPATCEPSPTL